MANLILYLALYLGVCSFPLVELVPASKNPIAPYEIYGRTGLVEGDILVKRKNVNRRLKLSSNRKIGYASSQPDSYLWPNGVIPYVFDLSIPYRHICLVKAAMLEIMHKSCIMFREKKPTDMYYIRVYKGAAGDCHATLGRNWGFAEGELSLGEGCYNFGTIVHELMHNIGFHHEHNRSDRDKYLRIHTHNIIPGYAWVFNKYKKHEEQIFTKFDFDSIMMYPEYAFSKDGRSPTISSKVKGKKAKYPTKLSKYDVTSIKKLYRCPKKSKSVCTKFAFTMKHMQHCPVESEQYLDHKLIKKMSKQCEDDR